MGGARIRLGQVCIRDHFSIDTSDPRPPHLVLSQGGPVEAAPEPDSCFCHPGQRSWVAQGLFLLHNFIILVPKNRKGKRARSTEQEPSWREMTGG